MPGWCKGIRPVSLNTFLSCRLNFSRVGRVRPIKRLSANALLKGYFCEEYPIMRWYREISPSVQDEQRAFIFRRTK